ncbi:MAG: AAA family ATPase [Polyangiaceae bacterium]|nr:AAA family ATPase [Polyangiaceae bacterium]
MTSRADKGKPVGNKPAASDGRPRKAGPKSSGRDVLAVAAEAGGLDGDALWSLREWLAEQLVGDQFAKLGQGGHTEERVPLRRVFVDLPISDSPALDTAPHSSLPTFLKRLHQLSPFPLSTLCGPESEQSELERESADDDAEPADEAVLRLQRGRGSSKLRRGSAPAGRRIGSANGGILLIGGPGQGKSTLGQLACQLHRAALLQPVAADLPTAVRDVLQPFIDDAKGDLSRSREPWLPFRVVLPDLAEKLADLTEKSGVNDATPALVRFLTDQSSARKSKLAAETLWTVARTMPVLLVLDGFDEVGSPEDREGVVNCAREFLTSLGRVDGHAVVVVTTRPQGYADEMQRIGVRLSHAYLAPLRIDEALAYGQKLISETIAGADDQESANRKLRAAAEDSGTARLLKTPLQVTILVALVPLQGPAPSERWKLFWSFFDFTYRRETARASYASALLGERRTQIEAIHARAALLLQVESESSGGAAARMPRARLEEIAETVLQEDGIRDSERGDLVRRIVDAAEKRLVFLVEPEPGAFGFEIRSLQEMMAAWALSEGDQSAVEARLFQVARAPMFRSVVQFLASKFFSERSALRELISTRLCAALDEDPAHPLARSTRAGAVLALDLLEEGSALGQPKRAQTLMERACGLLDLLPGTEILRLVRLFNEDVGPVVRAAVESRLGRAAAGETVPTLAAWVCVVVAAGAGMPWAREVADSRWESLREKDRLLDFLLEKHVLPSAWFAEKVERDPRGFLPDRVIRYFAGFRWADKLPKSPTSEGWLGTLSIEGVWADPLLSSPDGRWDVTARALVPRNRTSAFTALARMDSALPNWRAWVAAAKFDKDPNAKHLADALRASAIGLSSDGQRHLANWMAWPLATCLRTADSNADLERFAGMASRGELGDTDDWYRAEESWRKRSSLRAAILAAGGEAPWTLTSLGVGPPLVLYEDALWLPSGGGTSAALVRLADKAFRQARQSSIRAVLAGVCLHALLQGVALDVGPGSIAAWAGAVRVIPSWFSTKPPNADEHDWLHAVDILGARRLGRTSMSALSAARAYAEHPDNRGFLYWMALGAWTPGHGENPEPLLADLRQTILRRVYDSPAARADAAIVRTYLGAVEPSEVNSILDDVAAQAESEPGIWNFLARRIQWGHLPRESAEAMLLRIDELLGPLHVARERLMDAMRALLQSERSGLSSRGVWDRLDLPLPYPIARSQEKPKGILPLDPVILRTLKVKHLRVLGDVSFNFEVPTQGKGQWIVLLGENGVGKTTLLRSLTLALRNLSDPRIWPKGVFATPWRGLHGSGEAKIAVAVEGHAEQVTTIRANGTESFAQTPVQDRPRLFPVFAYGCRRGSALSGARTTPELGEDDGPEIATLFDEGADLVQASSWLVHWHSDSVDRERAKLIFDAIREGLRRLLDLDSLEVKRQEVWVSGDAVGQSVPFNALSDGYVTTAGWFVDLLARWIALADQNNAEIDENFMSRMTGLVLLDEIDLHIHPRWQVDVIGRVRQLLPKMSFVVTTHNPLTLVGARPGEIWRLFREDGKVCVESGTEAPLLLTGGQIYRRYFGMRDIYPNDLGRKLHRYGFLAGYAMRSDDEQREMEALRKELSAAQIDPGWEEIARETPQAPKTEKVPQKRSGKKVQGRAS